MVVQVVDFHGVSAFEPKRHPPVGRDGDRPVPMQAALERMKSKAGNVHSLGTAALVQGSQNSQEFPDVLLSYLC